MAEQPGFGTSGLRGLAGDLLEGVAARYAGAFLDLPGVLQTGRVLVGRDLRDSSPALVLEVGRAAAPLGMELLDCGPVPTPALALESQRLGLPAIMVTGSHIPADRNGLKFYVAGAEIDKAQERAIAGIVAQGVALPVTGHGPRPSEWPDVGGRYLGRYEHVLAKDALAGRRIGLWVQSTVAAEVFAAALGRAGAEVIALGPSKGFVPIDTEAVDAPTLGMLAAWVEEHRLDALVSADGDGDRPLVVDDRGRLVRGDALGAVTAHALGAASVVTPVTSNAGIEETGWFDEVIRTRVGSPYVIAAMAEPAAAGRAVIGFEANGGVLLGSDVSLKGGALLNALPTRDGLLPVLCVLGWAQGSLAAAIGSLPMRAARSGRLQEVERMRMEALMTRLRGTSDAASSLFGAVASVSDIDGLRFTLLGGEIVHVRPSGNAPELRCYVEAATAERADRLLAQALQALRGAIG